MTRTLENEIKKYNKLIKSYFGVKRAKLSILVQVTSKGKEFVRTEIYTKSKNLVGILWHFGFNKLYINEARFIDQVANEERVPGVVVSLGGLTKMSQKIIENNELLLYVEDISLLELYTVKQTRNIPNTKFEEKVVLNIEITPYTYMKAYTELPNKLFLKLLLNFFHENHLFVHLNKSSLIYNMLEDDLLGEYTRPWILASRKLDLKLKKHDLLNHKLFMNLLTEFTNMKIKKVQNRFIKHLIIHLQYQGLLRDFIDALQEVHLETLRVQEEDNEFFNLIVSNI